MLSKPHAAMERRLPIIANRSRCELLALLLVLLLALPTGVMPARVAEAQGAPPAQKLYRIGFLSQGQPPRAWIEALEQGLREQGFVAGRNITWELRWTDGSLDRLPRFAEELVGLKVDVIVARASSGGLAAKRATSAIPIVFAGVYGPVEVGLVPNLAHPAGNLTGTAVNASDIAAKRVQLLKELLPTLKRAVMLSHSAHPSNALQVHAAEAAARSLGIQLDVAPVRSADDFHAVLDGLHGIEGLLHADTPLFNTHRTRLIDAVARRRLPAIHPQAEYADAGGLMAYGADLPDLYRRAGIHVAKILKGAKPADLPVEQPTKFDLAINSRTARALGLTIPQSLLVRADRFVE
jgi:putative ABC transport system substrate-binding protein